VVQPRHLQFTVECGYSLIFKPCVYIAPLHNAGHLASKDIDDKLKLRKTPLQTAVNHKPGQQASK